MFSFLTLSLFFALSHGLEIPKEGMGHSKAIWFRKQLTSCFLVQDKKFSKHIGVVPMIVFRKILCRSEEEKIFFIFFFFFPEN